MLEIHTTQTENNQHAVCRVPVYGKCSWPSSLLLVEALGHQLQQEDWERALATVPYVVVTDSKSLFDCLNKTVCTYTQADDKRTAIDIAILKDDLGLSGGHPRWIEGANTIADPLTKKMRGDFLRGVANKGFWTLSFAGHQKLRSEHDILLLCIDCEIKKGNTKCGRCESCIGFPLFLH